MTADIFQPPSGLAECEEVIERGLAAFTEVGIALITIRDGRLYRGQYATFEAYCQDRWNLSRSRAYDLIGSTETARALSAIADTPLPTNEGQARELRGLEPEKAAEVMTEAAESGNVTAALIREARERIAPRPEAEGLDRPARTFRIVRPEPEPQPQEWTDQRQAESVSEKFAANVNDLFALGRHPERRRYLIQQWQRGQVGASPTQRANVNPDNFRLIAAAFTALAEEWESA